MKPYDTFAKLNEQGMKEFGDIFDDGYVPLRSIVGQLARLGKKTKMETIYLVAFEKMNKNDFDRLMYKLSKKFKTDKDIIKMEISRNGFPLRDELVKIVGTNIRNLI